MWLLCWILLGAVDIGRDQVFQLLSGSNVSLAMPGCMEMGPLHKEHNRMNIGSLDHNRQCHLTQSTRDKKTCCSI